MQTAKTQVQFMVTNMATKKEKFMLNKWWDKSFQATVWWSLFLY